jgi:hypothetical protein
MKSTTALVIARLSAAAMLLSFAGCIQMEHDLRINADGSATYSLNYSITEQAVTQFRAMFKLKNDLAVAAGEPPPGAELEPLLLEFLDPDEAGIREQLAPFTRLGLSIRTIRQETRSAARHIELVLDIADMDTLAGDPFFKKHGFDLRKDAEGRYAWSRAPHIDDAGAAMEPLSVRDLEQLTPLLSGFKTVIKVTPPGRILSTTAPRTSLQTAIWEFDFNRQPMAVQNLLRQHFHIVFDAAQVNLPELHRP